MKGHEVTSEFVTMPTASARAYNVPAAVVASIRDAIEDPRYLTHHDRTIASGMVSTGKAVLDDVFRIHTASDTDNDALRGGDDGRAWAARIVDTVTRDYARQRTERLDRYGYDDTKFAYAGIADPDNEDLVTHIVRFPAADVDLSRSEALTASGWYPVEFDFTGEDRNASAVALEPELFAFTASALFEDKVSGVLLSYATPLCFLEEQPLLASAPSGGAKKPGNVYAIVDATDTTAVMDLIMMRKGENGPQVYRRNGGKWTLDQALLDSFMSPAPPPIVELTGLHRNQIITQVDASNANQVVDDPGKPGAAELGEGAQELKTKPTEKDTSRREPEKNVDFKPKMDAQGPGEKAPPENREKRTPHDAEEGPNSRPPVTASAIVASYRQGIGTAHAAHQLIVDAASDHYYSDDGYRDGFSLVAALEHADHVLEKQRSEARIHAVLDAVDAIDAAKAYIAERDRIVIPVLAAGSKPKNAPTDNSSPNQQKAESLRKYWLRGKGAVKLKWGSSGDLTRCHRQLSKYMTSDQAWGWCNRRHREAVGYYGGDARNR